MADQRPGQSVERKRIKLALQGGGSHGAFTWGVLDRLLEYGGFEVEAIVGASAGAINAAVPAFGLAVGGPEGGRERLSAVWPDLGGRARRISSAIAPRQVIQPRAT